MFEVPKRDMEIISNVPLDLDPEREIVTLNISRTAVGMLNPRHDRNEGVRTGREE